MAGEDWTHFIDWMALSGVNLVLAMTGQEEVQHKVFQKFGLDDLTIRRWFNGPAVRCRGHGMAHPPLPAWLPGSQSVSSAHLLSCGGVLFPFTTICHTHACPPAHPHTHAPTPRHSRGAAARTNRATTTPAPFHAAG